MHCGGRANPLIPFERCKCLPHSDRKINERGPLTYLFRIMRFFAVGCPVYRRRQFSQKYPTRSCAFRSGLLGIRRDRAQTSGTPVVLDIHDVLPEFYASKFHVTHDSFMFRCLVLAERWSIAFANHTIVANHFGASGWRSVAECRKSVRRFATILPADLFNPNIRSRGNGKFLITYPAH